MILTLSAATASAFFWKSTCRRVRTGLAPGLFSPREMNGQPFINSDAGEVRFFAEYPVGIKVNRRFKVANMVYEGALEY